MSDDPVIQDVVDTVNKVAHDRVFELLATLDDEMADDVLAYMLDRRWDGSFTGTKGDVVDGNGRLTEWMALGRAVEETRNYLSSGFGQGRASMSGRKRELREVITLIYELANEYMLSMKAQIKEQHGANQSDG